MTFWCGSGSRSGSEDPCLWLMDPDPAIFVIDLQDDTKKTNFLKQVFLLFTFWSYINIIFHGQKVQKKSQNRRNQGFSYYYCSMIEGSGSGRPKTSGSGTGTLPQPMNWKLDLEDEGGVGVGGSNHQAADGEGGGALVRDLAVLDVQLRLLCNMHHTCVNQWRSSAVSFADQWEAKARKSLKDQKINMIFSSEHYLEAFYLAFFMLPFPICKKYRNVCVF